MQNSQVGRGPRAPACRQTGGRGRRLRRPAALPPPVPPPAALAAARCLRSRRGRLPACGCRPWRRGPALGGQRTRALALEVPARLARGRVAAASGSAVGLELAVGGSSARAAGEFRRPRSARPAASGWTRVPPAATRSRRAGRCWPARRARCPRRRRSRRAARDGCRRCARRGARRAGRGAGVRRRRSRRPASARRTSRRGVAASTGAVTARAPDACSMCPLPTRTAARTRGSSPSQPRPSSSSSHSASSSMPRRASARRSAARSGGSAGSAPAASGDSVSRQRSHASRVSGAGVVDALPAEIVVPARPRSERRRGRPGRDTAAGGGRGGGRDGGTAAALHRRQGRRHAGLAAALQAWHHDQRDADDGYD